MEHGIDYSSASGIGKAAALLANEKLDVEGVVVGPSEAWHGELQDKPVKGKIDMSEEEELVSQSYAEESMVIAKQIEAEGRGESMSHSRALRLVREEGTKAAIMARLYVDKTGTDEKPNPLRDVYHEFPLAMTEIAKVTAYGMEKHASRGWRTFKPSYGIGYHTGKLGRHLLAEETNGPINKSDGGLLHAAQVAWNALARLEHMLMFDRQGRGSK